jgi:hypothetical protein
MHDSSWAIDRASARYAALFRLISGGGGRAQDCHLRKIRSNAPWVPGEQSVGCSSGVSPNEEIGKSLVAAVELGRLGMHLVISPQQLLMHLASH